ncbi:hypothetical protein Tco_1219954 [Tanacetum coccineum]
MCFSIFALLFASRIAACSLLSSKRSRLISKASLFYTKSTSTVLNVGMVISVRMTASVPYVKENGVSPLLVFIMFLAPLFKWIFLELFPIVRDDLSWESKSTDNVFPHKFFDLIDSDGCNRFCFDPLYEVVNSYYQELEFSRSFRERSGYVNFPFVEWSWRRD